MSFTVNIDGGNEVAADRVEEYERALRECITAVCDPFRGFIGRADWQVAYVARRDELSGIESTNVAYRIVISGGVHDVDAPTAERIEYEMLNALHWLATATGSDAITGTGAQFHYAGSHAFTDDEALGDTMQSVLDYHASVRETAAAPACAAVFVDPNADHVHECGLPQHDSDQFPHVCRNDDCAISWATD